MTSIVEGLLMRDQVEKQVRIKNWAVCTDADSYTAPEVVTLHLHGEVYGHPYIPDGEVANTSYIKSCAGRFITTNKRTYELDGPPSDSYMEYLKSINHEYDPENPIKFKERAGL